jgi:hypothetical protein
MESIDYEKMPGSLKAIILVELINISERFRVLDLNQKTKELPITE